MIKEYAWLINTILVSVFVFFDCKIWKTNFFRDDGKKEILDFGAYIIFSFCLMLPFSVLKYVDSVFSFHLDVQITLLTTEQEELDLPVDPWRRRCSDSKVFNFYVFLPIDFIFVAWMLCICSSASFYLVGISFPWTWA